MADFYEIVFPEDISLGAQGGPGYNTIISEAANGSEKRQQNRKNPRRTYDVSHALQDAEMAKVLLSFFLIVSGRTIGFRFLDPHDYQTDTTVDMRMIDATHFQLQNKYTFGSYSYTRKITKPVDGSLDLYNPTTLAVLAEGSYAMDYTTGIATFFLAPGFVPKATFTFHVPVRFDVDDFPMQYVDVDVRTWEGIKLVELIK